MSCDLSSFRVRRYLIHPATHGISCCRLPIFKIENFDYGSQIKSLDFHLAPLQNLMSTLPYPHRHDFYQIDWVEHGTGHHAIDSAKYEVKPKTLFFMAPGQIHDFVLSDDTVGFTINFSAEFFVLQLHNKNMLSELPIYDLGNSVQGLSRTAIRVRPAPGRAGHAGLPAPSAGQPHLTVNGRSHAPIHGHKAVE